MRHTAEWDAGRIAGARRIEINELAGEGRVDRQGPPRSSSTAGPAADRGWLRPPSGRPAGTPTTWTGASEAWAAAGLELDPSGRRGRLSAGPGVPSRSQAACESDSESLNPMARASPEATQPASGGVATRQPPSPRPPAALQAPIGSQGQGGASRARGGRLAEGADAPEPTGAGRGVSELEGAGRDALGPTRTGAGTGGLARTGGRSRRAAPAQRNRPPRQSPAVPRSSSTAFVPGLPRWTAGLAFAPTSAPRSQRSPWRPPSSPWSSPSLRPAGLGQRGRALTPCVTSSRSSSCRPPGRPKNDVKSLNQRLADLQTEVDKLPLNSQTSDRELQVIQDDIKELRGQVGKRWSGRGRGTGGGSRRSRERRPRRRSEPSP